jgi:hypothetical protein
MICPRCGLDIGTNSLSRCPQCGQPLQAPMGQQSRITRVLSDEEPTGQSEPTRSEAWPDLYESVPVEMALGQESTHSVFHPAAVHDKPPERFSPAAGFFSPSLRAVNRRNVIIAVLAGVVILGLVLAGALYLARGHSPATASHGRTHNERTGPLASATSGSSTATGASGTPTASPTRQQSATSTPVPAPTASLTPQLVTLFFDPLTSNAHGWPTGEGCSFVSTGYEVSDGAECIAPVSAADSVNISVQMRFSTSGFEVGGIGFRIASVHPPKQYTFYVSSNGYCIAQDTSTHTIFFNTVSSAVKKGSGATNTLMVDQNGAHMTFYVNSIAVGSATDATLGAGMVALEGYSDDNGVIFTDFTLTTLK